MAPSGEFVSGVAAVKSKVLLNIKCMKCSRNVRNGILCGLCDRWNHVRCVNTAEDEIPDGNVEWKCPTCVGINSADNGDSEVNDVSKSVNQYVEIISSLQAEIDNLKEENLSLKLIINTYSNAPSDDTTIHNQTEDRHYRSIRWESVNYKRTSQHRQAVNTPYCPPLQNKYELLSKLNVEDDRPKVTKSQQDRPLNSNLNSNESLKNSHRHKVKILSDSQGKHASLSIHLHSDSQGRKVRKHIEMSENRPRCKISSFIKPNAKFKDILPSPTEKFGQDDLVVIMGGTNDIAFNGAKDLLSALRRKLPELQLTNSVVFSIPHRHDLPDWSRVNAEIKRTNDEMKKICKYFKTCSFVDISSIGPRFYTRHGFHLGRLGKQYVGDKIVECMNSLLASKDQINPIPLTDGSFLD